MAYRALAGRLWTPPPSDPEAEESHPERLLAGARRERQRLGA
jgi:hypothetical protein